MGYRIGQYSDFLVRGTISDPPARFVFSETRQTVTAGILAHDADPVCADFFGRALTVAALMGALLKDGEKYTLRWEYKGPVGSLLVDVNTEGHIRGIPRTPHLADQAEVATGGLLGRDGTVTVVRSRNGRILGSGSAPAALLDIADDMGYFLATSDQVESEFVTVLEFNPSPENPVKVSAGFLLQPMPGAPLEEFDVLRKSIRTEAFREALFATGLPWEPKLKSLIERILDTAHPSGSALAKSRLQYELGPPPSYTCSCSPERMKAAIALLEKEELEEIFRAEGSAEVVCEFCRRSYRFAPDEIGPGSR